MNKALPRTLTEQALGRLHRLAEGNGLASHDIEIVKSDERIYTLEADTTLKPGCTLETKQYIGPLKNKKIKGAANFAALQAEAEGKKRDLESNPAQWIDAALHEIKKETADGWGISDAKVMLPDLTQCFGASEPCSSCQGQKLIPCPTCQRQGYVPCSQCRGQGQELCYHCMGQRHEPQNPNQPCHKCQGTQFAPCRICVLANHPRGFMPCPQCRGKKGIPCSDCHSFGIVSREIILTLAADVQFRLRTGGLPSSFNRALERIGLTKLPQKHADIEVYQPNDDEMFAIKEKLGAGVALPSLFYRAKIPFADLRVRIKQKMAMIASFGKQGLLLGVPPFLDEALSLARENLNKAAYGKAPLTAAMQARAISEAVKLINEGKPNQLQLRRLYPYGLSPKVMEEILHHAEKALTHLTLRDRILGAGIAVASALSLSFFVLKAKPYETFSLGQGWRAECIKALIAGLSFSAFAWIILIFVTRFRLQQRFSKQKIGFFPKLGYIGLSMQLLLIVGFFAELWYLIPNLFARH